MAESQSIEYKSLKKVTGKNPDFRSLSETCVALANTPQGGHLIIGIEDGADEPVPSQIIEIEVVNKVIQRLKSLTSSVGISCSGIEKHKNGGEYFIIKVFPSSRIIATTSTGKVLTRVADNTVPVAGDELTNLAADKNAFQWELVQVKFATIEGVNPLRIDQFCDLIRESDRVKPHIKEFSNPEILEHYFLTDEGVLTNLGVLWLGTPRMRSKISYPIKVQYIVYDELENKTRKISWDDYTLNPMELIRDVEAHASELAYFHEFPDGIFRKQVRHYDPRIIRELLVNAIAHKTYTISGDIFIEVYPDRLEITNPGKLPFGITKDNILHKRYPRNPNLTRILHDLKLMEGEGTGYDLIFEIDARDSKPFPIVYTDVNSTKVTQSAKILDSETVLLLDYVSKNFSLSQKEFIALGIISRHKKILSTKLSSELQLKEEERMRSYTGRLLNLNILALTGVKKGASLIINPKLLSNSKLNIKASLKTIEPYKLKALIQEDLKVYPNSSISDIHKRIGDIPREEIQKSVYQLVEGDYLESEGGKRNRVYRLAKKK